MVAAVTVPLAVVLWAIVRYTRARTRLAFLLAIGAAHRAERRRSASSSSR